MTDTKPVDCWLTDMDGVLVHEERRRSRGPRVHRGADRDRAPLPGADQQLDLHPARPAGPAADAAASTCPRRRSGPRRWPPRSSSTTSGRAARRTSIGEAGLTTALHDIGYVLTDRDPDYVVLGETRTYSFEAITRAIRLIEGGARFIATNPDAERAVAPRARCRRPGRSPR